MNTPTETPELTCHCGHARARHFHGRGMCEVVSGAGTCPCRRFKLPVDGGSEAAFNRVLVNPETPASLLALADEADAFCGEPTERSAELRDRAAKMEESEKLHAVAKRVGRGRRGNAREADIHERAAEMERSTCTCGKWRPNPDDEPRLCPVHGNGFGKPAQPQPQPQPQPAGKPTGPARCPSCRGTKLGPVGQIGCPVCCTDGAEWFREWCGNSYEWDALSDMEKQRWNRFAAGSDGLTPRQLEMKVTQLANKLRASEKDTAQALHSCGALTAQLEDALAALRQLYQWSIAEGPAWGRDDNADDARRNARAVLAKGGQNGQAGA